MQCHHLVSHKSPNVNRIGFQISLPSDESFSSGYVHRAPLAESGISLWPYYNRATIIATIVITISWNISYLDANFIILLDNAPAYCDYDRSYDRSSVIVQATGIELTNSRK